MTNRIQYFHVRRPSITVVQEGLSLERIGATGGLTVAYRTTPPSVVEGAVQVYEVAIARCRNDEHYNKRYGREIATDKLLAGKGELLAATEDTFIAELAKLIHKSAAKKNVRAGVRNGTVGGAR